jgi:hypothetical protein
MKSNSVSPTMMTSQAELIGSRSVSKMSRSSSATQSRIQSGQPSGTLSKRSRATTSNINFIDYELMFESPPVYEPFDEFKAKSVKNKNTVSFYENPVIVPIDAHQSVPSLKEYEESSPEPIMVDTPSTLNVNTPIANINTPDLYRSDTGNTFLRQNNESSLDYDFPFPIVSSTPNNFNKK